MNSSSELEAIWQVLIMKALEHGIPTVSNKSGPTKSVMQALILLKKFNLMPVHELCAAKNNEKARRVRQTGNSEFGLGGSHFYTALELYNQSLCMAEPGSDDYGIALANRSAVYVKLRKYDLSLSDIKCARELGCPAKLLDKLMARKKTCHEMMKKSNYMPSIEPESTLPGKPFVNPCVERHKNDEYGRFLISTKLVNPCDVLIFDDNVIRCTTKELRFKRCWHCAAECNMQLLPCKTCTQVMFCSEACAGKAMTSYHQYECPIIDYLVALFPEALVLRMVVQGVLAFGSLVKIQKFLQLHGQCKVDVFGPPCHDGAYENDDQRKFHEIFNLETKSYEIVLEEMKPAFVAAILFRQMTKHTPMRDECASSQLARDVLAQLLFHFQKLKNINCQGLSMVSLQDVSYCLTISPIVSLMNHSCAPNVMIVGRKSQTCVMALRVIQPGEQLFNSYCENSMPKNERQKLLKHNYMFICKCEMCTGNCPTLSIVPLLNIGEILPLRIIMKPGSDNNNLIAKLKAYLIWYGRQHPRQQLFEVQLCLFVAVQIQCGSIAMDEHENAVGRSILLKGMLGF